MNIVTALNKKYIPYTSVMLLSAGMNTREHINAYLLHSELEKEDLSYMQTMLEEYGVTINGVFVEREELNDRLPCNDQWGIETYYRLLMLELLPQSIHKALYLDGDIIVNKALDELYSKKLDDKDMLVCDDKSGMNDIDSYGKKNRQMMIEAYDHGHRYFNAGVMLLNIELMRRKYSFRIYQDAIKAWNYEMEASDQDILNWVHWRNIGYLDCQVYDLFARIAHNAGITYDEVKDAVTIIHYAGSKPWNNEGVHFDIERLWWDYAKKTRFYKKLMEEFVESALNDRSIETQIKDLIETNKETLDKLKKIMERVKNTKSG